jgi:lipopolysaccharide export system protein LptC
MKAKLNWTAIVLALSLLFFAGWTARGQKQSASTAAAPPRVTWEYKVVSESDKITLNEMGAQGWELVTVVMGGAQDVYYFKRVK